MRKLRVHHLFCSALYQGKGYNRQFCENMDKVAEWLWSKEAFDEKEERKVELIAFPDTICQACPNLKGDHCSLDDDNVVSKDAKLADALHLQIDKIYSVPELFRCVKENMTEEIFETSCHKCEWYHQKLCSYDSLARKYDRLF